MTTSKPIRIEMKPIDEVIVDEETATNIENNKTKKAAPPPKDDSSSTTMTATSDVYIGSQLTFLDHLLFIIKLWWRHLTMRVSVPRADMEELKTTCLLREGQINRLYKQFRVLVNDRERNYLTVADLERHSSLLSGNPLKKYIYRMLFWGRDQLTFVQFVENLSLTLSNCIGCPQIHLVKSMRDISFFTGVTCPKDVVQIQKLLALFNCFDLKETGCLDTMSLCQVLYDLLRCDSAVNVSSLVPPSMLTKMVNTAIANVHDKLPKVCAEICDRQGSQLQSSPSMQSRRSSKHSGSLKLSRSQNFDGHKMLLTKEIFIRDQEDLHLDQLLAMRL